MAMERWFMEHAAAAHNFAESGVPDFTLKGFLEKTGVSFAALGAMSLGNNDTRGSAALREDIAGLYGCVGPDDILVGNGTSELLYIFSNLFLGEDRCVEEKRRMEKKGRMKKKGHMKKKGRMEKKRRVLVLFPAFPPLYLLPEALGADVDCFDLLDFEARAAMVTALAARVRATRPDLVIVNTPHNPTGCCLSDEEIVALGRAAQEAGSVLLFDEHYRFLPLGEGRRPFVSGYDLVRPFYERVFAVGSMIKCCGMVGTRIGWLIGAADVIGRARDYKDFTTHCVPFFNEEISRIAIRNLERLTGDFIAAIRKNWAVLKAHPMTVAGTIELNYEVEGGCVCFPRLGASESLRCARKLVEDFGVSVLPGEVFRKKGYLRINLARPPDAFGYLLSCLERVLREG